jgi:hypothetical protein
MTEGQRKKPQTISREELYRQMWQMAITRLNGDCCFLNVPLPFAAVRASGCSVPAR